MVTFVLLYALSIGAAILFHSNFENERTYTATALKPGATKIELLPSPEIEQWFPETGGEAIIEPNYPKNREVFTYTRRKDNKLLGVHGIKKPHAKYVVLRTGGLAEWYTEGREIIRHARGKISAQKRSPLAGEYSAQVACEATSPTLLTRHIPPGKFHQLHVRFLIRFTGPFWQKPVTDFALFYASIDSFQLPRLSYSRRDPKTKGIMHFTNPPRSRTVADEKAFSMPIFADTVYCVELGFQKRDQNLVIAKLWINGRLCRERLTKHQPGIVQKRRFSLGKASVSPHAGSFELDEIVISQSPIGPLASVPALVHEDSGLSVQTSTQNAIAGHWQISDCNAWLTPAFNSGRDSLHVDWLPHPHYLSVSETLYSGVVFDHAEQALIGIPAGKTAFARVRQLGKNGLWSSWSHPLAFTIAAPPVDLKNKAFNIRHAYFSQPNHTRETRHLSPNNWYDLHLQFTPCTHRSFLDVVLNARPASGTHNHINRGGAFNAANNYVFSIAFQQNALWVKQTDGSNRADGLQGTQGLFCDDRKGVSVFEPQKGEARIRLRLLEEAEPGTWKLSAFLVEHGNGLSTAFQKLFFVRSPTSNEPIAGSRPLESAWWLLLGVVSSSLFMGGWMIIQKARKRKKESAAPVALARDAISSERIRSANDFILENYSQSISLQDVAKHVGVSPNWLSKYFKRETGKNVVNYVNELRVEKALRLLKETGLNVGDIAFRVGFNSVGNFNITFKRMMGQSPIAVRAKMQRGLSLEDIDTPTA